jgi:ABC-type branched-subunit amino acid transport system ATPase component
MVEPILKTQNLWKRFGALAVAEDVSIDLGPNEIHALIGPNGAGKTSLAALISGLLKPDDGQIFFEGADITGYAPTRRASLGMARTSQLTSIFRDAGKEQDLGDPAAFTRRGNPPALRYVTYEREQRHSQKVRRGTASGSGCYVTPLSAAD